MGQQVFRLQIAWPDGTVVVIPAGGPLEVDFVRACTDAICAQGVGVFKTEAHVRVACEAGIISVIKALKVQTVPLVNARG